jgi:hypothetical protein
MVNWEDCKQISYLVVKMLVEKIPCYLKTFRKVSAHFQVENFFDFFELGPSSRRSCVLFEICEESSGILNKVQCVLGAISKHGVEMVPAPLNAMFNQVWEVS